MTGPAARTLAVLLALGTSSPAWACAVCFDPNDPSNKAYFDMTIFMSLFPLLAMGTIGWWLYRQYSAPDPDEVRSPVR